MDEGDGYRTIRVRLETYRRLRALQARIQRVGLARVPEARSGTLSLSDVLDTAISTLDRSITAGPKE